MACGSLNLDKALTHVQAHANERMATTVNGHFFLAIRPKNLETVAPAIKQLVSLDHVMSLILRSDHPGVLIFAR